MRPKVLEALAVGRLIDEFGGDVLVKWDRAAEISTAHRAMRRMMVEEALAALATTTGRNIPMPSWSPHRLPRDGRIAIIGPSPAYEDAKHGELGWSRASRRLHRELKRCGVDGRMVTDLTAVPHWPQNGSQGQRPPTTRELTEARPLLLAALDAADVDHVILHGSHAMHQWRKDLKLEDVAGCQFLWGSRWWATPIMHWSAVTYDTAMYERRWSEHIATVAETLYDPDPVMGQRLSSVCVAKGCRGSVDAWDEDGVPWCRSHVARGQGGHRHAQPQPPTVQGELAI